MKHKRLLREYVQLCYVWTVVVVILMVMVNRMYKKRNGISLGRSPWRIDNCSIHRIQTEESTALITLASAIAMVIIINGINSSRHGSIGAWMGGIMIPWRVVIAGPYGPWLSEAICRIYPGTLTIGQILTSV